MHECISLKIALDWTPNTIHTGLYLAQDAGCYAQQGLDVQIVVPDERYSQTPAKLLQSGQVDLAICPSESCIAYNASEKMKLQAIYAILQEDASAIVSTTLNRIRDLGNGKVYGSYNARYEDRIVQAMIDKDGGQGSGVKIEQDAGRLGLFGDLKAGKIDATWVFLPWEGIEAGMDNVQLHAFKAADFGIPYGYSPVIAHDASKSSLDKKTLSKFVTATMEGYRLALQDVPRAVRVLGKHCTPQRSAEFLVQSQELINKSYIKDGIVGRMSQDRWSSWLRWLEGQGLLGKGEVDEGAVFYNP